MTEILIVCFILLGFLAASTLALAAIPVVPGELSSGVFFASRWFGDGLPKEGE
jgi:hypothetical protein